ncbi:hypothetical protein C0995_004105 [Termitomyces sp. Mi166|nr:hypothetical protein C0995_004105 [Termitomyces sp. Mi166\
MFGFTGALLIGFLLTSVLYGVSALQVNIGFLVHLYFTLQIFRLSEERVKWWLASFIGFLAFAQFGLGIITSAFLIIKKDFVKFKSLSMSSVLPFVILALLSDIMIATALCMLLRGNRTEFKRTKTLLNKLIIYAINRCVLILVVALTEGILVGGVDSPINHRPLELFTIPAVLCLA